ncbi:hypothetical protein [Vibrio phage phiKT1019]|nr:hypothetical protein [Vibrio phage phiKT1019]
MKHFIDALQDIKNESQLAVQQRTKVNWSHQFNITKEGYLPQWSGIINVPGLEVAVKELEWVLSKERKLDILHEAGMNHRDYLAAAEDLIHTREYTYDERVDLAIKKFSESDVVLRNADDLQLALVDNGLMQRYLTVEKCLDAMGFTAIREEVVCKEGETAISWGEAFGNPTSTGAILFHNPKMLPKDQGISYTLCLSENRYTYLPKQIMLSFMRTDIPLEVRMEGMDALKANPYVDLIEGILQSKPFAELKRLGLELTEEVYMQVGDQHVLHQLLDDLLIPRHELHSRLQLSELDPLKEFGIEVLPYALYAEHVAHRMNMVHSTFTLDVNYLVMEQETLAMLDKIQDAGEKYKEPALVRIDRPQDLTLVDVPLTTEEVKTTSYFGA